VKNGSQDEGNIKRSYSTLSKSGETNSFEIMFISNLGKSNPSVAEIYAMFTKGGQTFSDRTIDGIIVNWKDENGKTWTSDKRFGSASNSNLTISNVGNMSSGKPFEVSGTINCRVYDLLGVFKTIENGKFVLYFDATK
jgi:hypothetical protein